MYNIYSHIHSFNWQIELIDLGNMNVHKNVMPMEIKQFLDAYVVNDTIKYMDCNHATSICNDQWFEIINKYVQSDMVGLFDWCFYLF